MSRNKKFVKFTRNKNTIKLRLECWDQVAKEFRRSIELGYPIPSINVLIQPI